ncbi:MAG: adenylate/guanylate cyclase domain-containing protein [Granulosicoccus sp.]
MSIPFYRPGRHSMAMALLLLMVLTLLVLTGLGVFRLYFAFEWTAGSSETGQLFSLAIRGGRSLNLFEAEPFGSRFWAVQLLLVMQCVLMPLFRLTGGSLIALAIAAGVFLLHVAQASESQVVPLEFELLIILVLFLIYLLATLIYEMREQRRVSRVLSQFVPTELAEEYQRDPRTMTLAGEERMISVLFCDARDFSSVTQALETAQLAQWLNLYFSYVSRIIVRYRGSIDKYIGDSVMAVRGAPTPSSTHAFDALSAAMDIQDELEELNLQYRSLGWPEVAIGVGISSGLAMVGPLGSEYRMDYTVIGDTVNIAQHVEAQTRKYRVPIIVSDRTASELPDILFRELDTITVKGRLGTVTMYEPLGSRTDASDTIRELLDLHERAMACSKMEQWDEALRLFSELRDRWGPAQRYDLYIRGIEQARS